MEYKKCFVPTCNNDSINSPNKIIAKIREDVREQWCKQVNVEYFKIYTMYCCEDHFDPKKDLKNYNTFKKNKKNPAFHPNAELRYLQLQETNNPLLEERKSTTPVPIIPTKPTKSIEREITSGSIDIPPEKIIPNAKSLNEYSRSCRICLVKIGPMRPLFGEGLDLMLSNLMHLEVTPEDGYPQRVCGMCIQKLRSLYLFYTTARNNHKFLDQVAENEEGPLKKKLKTEETVHNNVTNKQDTIIKKSVYCQTDEKVLRKLACPRCRLKCSRCLYTAPNLEALKIHFVTHTPGGAGSSLPEAYELCHHCGKTFRTQVTLINHLKTHNEEIPSEYLEASKDNEPGKDWSVQDSKSVPNPKPYDCDMCNRAFRLKVGLRRHKENYHAPADRRYSHQCEHCDKRFCSKFGLQKHQLRQHTPSKCNRCGELCAGVTTLEHHTRLHKINDLKKLNCLKRLNNLKRLDNLKKLKGNTKTVDAEESEVDQPCAQYIEVGECPDAEAE